MIAQLDFKIRNRKACIAIVGVGYVGLTLAVKFAQAGFRVIGQDIDRKRVTNIKNHDAPSSEFTVEDLRTVLSTRKLDVTQSSTRLQEADIILVCVQTPLTNQQIPNLRPLKSAIQNIARFGKKCTLLVLVSTSFPGTADELVIPLIRKHMKTPPKFFSVVPERIDPGNKTFSLSSIPLVIGGLNADSVLLTRKLFSTWVKKIVVVSSMRTAEMAKILENSFRFINISFINEFARHAEKFGVDIWETVQAAQTKPFGYTAFYPGPGIGGQCIPVDPMFLNWRLEQGKATSEFIQLAKKINSSQPKYLIQRLTRALEKVGKKLSDTSIIILGLTYKPNVDSMSESRALIVFQELKKIAKKVEYCDPYISKYKHNNVTISSLPLRYPLFSKADCVLLLVKHRLFNYKKIKQHARYIFDAQGEYKTKKSPKIALL